MSEELANHMNNLSSISWDSSTSIKKEARVNYKEHNLFAHINTVKVDLQSGRYLEWFFVPKMLMILLFKWCGLYSH